MKKLNEFRDQLISGEASKDDWLNFKKVASKNLDSLPTYLKLYLSDLKHIEATGISKSDIVILDHGCGSGVTVLFLLANGYTKVFGVDPKTHKYKNLNKNLSERATDLERMFWTPASITKSTPGSISKVETKGGVPVRNLRLSFCGWELGSNPNGSLLPYQPAMGFIKS